MRLTVPLSRPRMGSQGVDSNESLSKHSSLCRQGSLYSLTLDEVQIQLGNLGKPLGSMNLDELLRTVCTVEANQSTGMVADWSSIPGQFGSSRDLSKRTVEEVWREIQQGKKRTSEIHDPSPDPYPDPDRQHTLGEMTLEDFLVQAGVVDEAPLALVPNPGPGIDSVTYGESNASHQAQWTQYHQMIPPQQQNMMTVFMPGQHIQQPVSDSGYPDVGTSPDSQMPGRKRVASGELVERTVERRQKRMIKNRESAARSRARKQAYTNELEKKVSRLEEENKRLKGLKEVEKVLPNVPIPEPKFQLRRTSSAPL